MNELKPILLNLLIPLLVSGFFALVLIYESKLPEFIFSISSYLLYSLSLIILWVSWHFNRNKFIFIIIPIILIYIGFEYLSVQKATALYMLVTIVFPIHLLIFLLLRERGLFSIWGILKISFLVLELGVILYFVYYAPESLKALSSIKIFAINFYPLKDISVVIGLGILFVMIALVMFNHFLMYNSSFLVILLAYYFAMYNIKTPYAIEMSFLAIAFIIFIILIRETYKLAFYDELTGLPGRRALIEDMAKLGRTYTLAMIDIDFFKKFNDTYGHDTGDEVLKMVASKLADVSGGGKAYRYGGEEFTILFPSKDVAESFIHADILRENIASTPFMVRNKKKAKKIFINISAGIVQNTSKDKDPFAVMKRADNALYKAKEAGRNKVVKA